MTKLTRTEGNEDHPVAQSLKRLVATGVDDAFKEWLGNEVQNTEGGANIGVTLGAFLTFFATNVGKMIAMTGVTMEEAMPIIAETFGLLTEALPEMTFHYIEDLKQIKKEEEDGKDPKPTLN